MVLNTKEILDRMKLSVEGLKSDSDLARFLNITPQAIYNFKKQGKLPGNLIIDFALVTGLSIDWLVFCKGMVMAEDIVDSDLTIEEQMKHKRVEKFGDVGHIDERLMLAVIEEVEESEVFASFAFSPAQKARFIIGTYKDFLRNKDEVDKELIKKMISAFDTIVQALHFADKKELSTEELENLRKVLYWKEHQKNEGQTPPLKK